MSQNRKDEPPRRSSLLLKFSAAALFTLFLYQAWFLFVMTERLTHFGSVNANTAPFEIDSTEHFEHRQLVPFVRDDELFYDSESNDDYIVTTTLNLSVDDEVVRHAISFQQLSNWVYRGTETQQQQALLYLPDLGISALPLQLFLVHSSTNLAIKESAILQLQMHNEVDVNKLLQASLNQSPHLKEAIEPLASVKLDERAYDSHQVVNSQEGIDRAFDLMQLTSAQLEGNAQLLSFVARELYGDSTERAKAHAVNLLQASQSPAANAILDYYQQNQVSTTSVRADRQ